MLTAPGGVGVSGTFGDRPRRSEVSSEEKHIHDVRLEVVELPGESSLCFAVSHELGSSSPMVASRGSNGGTEGTLGSAHAIHIRSSTGSMFSSEVNTGLSAG